jgi:hypothetical protein
MNMTRRLEQDLCTARDVNERAAAYAHEVIELSRANAVLREALRDAVEWMAQYDDACADTWTMAVLASARNALDRANLE